MPERKRRYVNIAGDGGRTAEEGAVPRSHIGAWLRERREELGYSLDDLAVSLRIRHVYLEAIEQGRWNDLPGQAYIVGFLRSYAGALGLESGPILRRFKEEMAHAPPPAELYFPEPVNENRLPGGAVLLIAAVLGVLTYGGWYALSAADRSLADLVPPLPERLAVLLYDDAPTAPAPEPAAVLPPSQMEALVGQSQPTAPEVGAPSAAPVAGSLTVGPDAAPNTPEDVSAMAAPPVAAPPTAPAPTSVPSGVPGDGTDPAGTAPNVTAPAPAAPADGSGMPAAAPPATSPQAALPQDGASQPGAASGDGPEVEDSEATLLPELTLPASAGMDPTAPPASEGAIPGGGAEAPPPTPPATLEGAGAPPVPVAGRVFGQVDGPARIVIRAVEDSWIQVRDAKGTLWASRVLRPGDVFRAPDVPGLVMDTGNAGGLVVSLDGRDLAPLGNRTQVVKEVPLAPDALEHRVNSSSSPGRGTVRP